VAILDQLPGEVTQLLRKWENGESQAFNQLLPLVYQHLRTIAAAYVRRERNPGVMQATSLVHELYLRLLAQKKTEWKDRAHFYTFASKMMRLILIDQARSTLSQKRGAEAEHIPLSDDLPWVNFGSPELLDLDRALEALDQKDAALVRLIEMRYFLGCSIEEMAELLCVSEATVKRDLRFAKTWLFRRIAPASGAQNAAPA
jgi:RNA polymerase sigma factor (TIGR02999 family)